MTQAILAGGCALALARQADAAPPPSPPEIAPPPAAAPAAVGPVTLVAGGPPMSLEDAVHFTLTRNERAKISDLNVDVAEAAREKALTAFLPLLTSVGQDIQHAYAPSTTMSKTNNTATANVTLVQPLVDVPLFPLYAQAKHLATAQHAQNVDDKRLLGFAGATAFFTVLNAQALLEAAQRLSDNSRANLTDTTARAQSGLTSTNDVTRAQVDLSGAARQVEVAKGAVDNAYVQLAFTVNAPVPANVVSPTTTLGAAQQPAGAPDTLVRLALDRRPDVQVAKYQALAAHAFASEPLLRIIPILAVQGQVLTGNALPSSLSSDETVQGTLTWNIFDQGVRYADKHSRDALADIADLNLKMLERNVDAQVRSAVALLVSAQDALRDAADSVKFAASNVEETGILYRQGLAKAIELVDANDSRFTAEVNYASAQFAMAEAYLNLRQALGLDALGTELK